MPGRFAQRDRLTGQPRARAGPRVIVPPMFRFVSRLAVEFEDEGRMASLQKVVVDILMTRYTGVGADIEAAQVAHPGCDAHRISPVGASVSAQPRASRAVAAFARHALVRVRGGSEPRLLDGLKRRMTNRATRARLRFSDSHCLGNSRRT